MKIISIITVCLNDAEGLRKTIKSVSSQTFKDFEFIIIDGGSTDGSLMLIKENERIITKWISESDTGIFNAQNKGIDLAQGEFCLFLNSGDYLADKNVIQNIFPHLETKDIYYGDMIVERVNGDQENRKSPLSLNKIQFLRDTLWHPVSFIRRSLFIQYGKYDERFKIVSDYEFFVRVIIGKKVSTKYIPLAVSVFNLTGVSSDPAFSEKLMDERKIVQDKYFNPLLLFLFRLYSKLMN